jgi:hypothetical protein
MAEKTHFTMAGLNTLQMLMLVVDLNRLPSEKDILP